MYQYNPRAPRLVASVYAGRAGEIFTRLFFIFWIVFLALGLLLLIPLHRHSGLSVIGAGLLCAVPYLWLSRDAARLTAANIGTTTALDQLLPIAIAPHYRPDLAALELWNLLATTPAAPFLLSRFGLHGDAIAAGLSSWQMNHDDLFNEAGRLGTELGIDHFTPALLICALFNQAQQLTPLLTAAKLTLSDLAEGALWLYRLDMRSRRQKPLYGGIARDWASGYTPQLNRLGTNLSQMVEYAPAYGIDERTVQLDALASGLESGTGSVVLVGEPGIGKTALLIGLADKLLQGEHGSLAHHQIISLNASMILSNVQGDGDLERTVLGLFDEAVAAGNIVLALDEAQLFFGSGTGAVNLSQVLLPLLQAHHLKLVLALTPGDWQKLRATNTGMASLLTPLVLSEPSQTEVVRLEADHAILMEHDQITTWNALLEAYRLSARYFEDEAYPGRALKLLEAAYHYPDGPLVSDRSVQQAVENQFGVKVGQASSTETDALLHLEDDIHKRMINQTRAVSVVASALRRARAGVASPKRPIGSFLFLGPTGVGKTELARSLAATYFKAENNIIRLDMSEYQQTADVDRILESAAENPAGLLPRLRQSPFSVVLFDEIEKAHPNILNLFLQLLDEGNLTDTAGHPTSFKDAIVIATSNAGAEEIRQRIEAGQKLEAFEQEFINNLIDSGAFRPELLNRFDEIVLFRPLNEAELGQVVKLMVGEVNTTLENQKITVELTDDAAAELVAAGYDPRLGARPMRRMVQRRVQDAVAGMILRGEAQPGSTITLDASHLATAAVGEPGNEQSRGDQTAPANEPAADQPAGPDQTPPPDSNPQ